MFSDGYYTSNEIMHIFELTGPRFDALIENGTFQMYKPGYFRLYDVLETLFFYPYLKDNLCFVSYMYPKLNQERKLLLVESKKFRFSLDQTLREYFSVSSVTKILDYMSRATVYRLIRDGDLKAEKYGSRIQWITFESLRDFISKKKSDILSTENPIYTPSQVAELLDVTTSSVAKWCRIGKLKATQSIYEGNWYIKYSDFIQMLKIEPKLLENLRSTTAHGYFLQKEQERIKQELADVHIYNRSLLAKALKVTEALTRAWMNKGILIPSAYTFTGKEIFDANAVENLLKYRPEYRKNYTDYNRRRDDTVVS